MNIQSSLCYYPSRRNEIILIWKCINQISMEELLSLQSQPEILLQLLPIELSPQHQSSMSLSLFSSILSSSSTLKNKPSFNPSESKLLSEMSEDELKVIESSAKMAKEKSLKERLYRT